MSQNSDIQVEVCLRRCEINSEPEEIRNALKDYLRSEKVPLNTQVPLKDHGKNAVCLQAVESITVECNNKESNELTPEDVANATISLYVPHEQNAELETIDNGEADGELEATPASRHWLLPSRSFVGLWENLMYDNNLKEKILSYCLAALKFSQHNVNHNIISCNRLILLHGPPGTGKTSLCKAVAQKLAVRLNGVYRYTHLIEINSHSLFSKWFSESGKLVMKLFAKIHEILADPRSLVCILIDEVESLAYSRDGMSSHEPRDAMRVVNAVLTQLDAIKGHGNVLILATSNLAKTIDNAFMDRVDIKQFVGFPENRVIKRIYDSMLTEMVRVGLLVEPAAITDREKCEKLLQILVDQSLGLSGRALRKLPFLALASNYPKRIDAMDQVPMLDFLENMYVALETCISDNKLQ